jgi:peptidoglycan/xylan/chitin deacetylase (PgdA/CDA1 family)
MRGLRARLPQRPRPLILMYHRVAHEPFDPWQLAVTPARFAEQLEWLARNRTVLRLVEFAELHRRGELPSDAVALTFDDGYACTAEIAGPLLDWHGLPATIFIAADAIREGRQLWWDELQQIVIGYSGERLKLGANMIDIGERQDRDLRWPQEDSKRTPRQRAFYDLWLRLRTLPNDELRAALAELSAQCAERPRGSHRLMTPAQARSMRSQRIEFGSHSLTHSSLPHLPAADKAREIRESVSACAAVTGSSPLSFAYPFGDFDADCEALVRDSGFLCATTAENRPVSPTDNPFLLPRIQVGSWTARRLRVILNGLSLAT